MDADELLRQIIAGTEGLDDGVEPERYISFESGDLETNTASARVVVTSADDALIGAFWIIIEREG